MNEQFMYNDGPDDGRTFENYFTDKNEVVDFLQVLCRTRFKKHNQIFISGKKGNGSSHLAHAVANKLVRLYGDEQVFLGRSGMLAVEGDEKRIALMKKCPVLILDNIHEWAGRRNISDFIFPLLEERTQHNRPVLFTYHEDADAAIPENFPLAADAVALQSGMPNRQALFRIVKHHVTPHPEMGTLLPDYAFYYAMYMKFKSVQQLLNFADRLCDRAEGRRNLIRAQSSMVELFVKDQYRQFNKERK